MIKCEAIDGKIRITTDDAHAEAAKVGDVLKGTEWEAAYAATRMVDGLLVFEPEGVNASDLVEYQTSLAHVFVETVGIEPGDEIQFYDPVVDAEFDEEEDD